jgi:CDP-paratose 2-epimerase
MNKKVAIITGSGGLVGVESVRFFHKHFDLIIGIDNDSRGYFFGPSGSVSKNIETLCSDFENYEHYPIDIRDKKRLNKLFLRYKSEIKLIINAAAQPSHDWSGRYPIEDFEINAVGALNILEEMRNNCPSAVFIQLSSSKVYGDNMNEFDFTETNTRFDLLKNHKYFNGFSEDMAIDQSLHSPYGASKLASDLMCQEYARYYGLQVGVFRPNCITGGPHSGVELHGFLSYLVKCKTTYKVFGFKGKQVRDNIHARDLVSAFFEYFKNPKAGEVYNIGGGRENSCSIIEAIEMTEQLTQKKIDYEILDNPRVGDHIWWISNNEKFQKHYPNWKIKIGLEEIINEINQKVENENI